MSKTYFKMGQHLVRFMLELLFLCITKSKTSNLKNKQTKKKTSNLNEKTSNCFKVQMFSVIIVGTFWYLKNKSATRYKCLHLIYHIVLLECVYVHVCVCGPKSFKE